MGITAPELFALSHNIPITGGPDRCHWCGSACERRNPHDDVGYQRHFIAPIDPDGSFYRKRSTAKCPGNSYVCVGCQTFRRKRITVTALNGKWVDKQEPKDHSWWVDRTGAFGVTQECVDEVFKRLLEPPHQFTLMLFNKTECPDNLIHLAEVNDVLEIKGDTPLVYTINLKPLTYTVHELEDAIENGHENKAPGIRALFNYFGVFTTPKSQVEKKEKRGRGRPEPKRPPDDNPIKRVVTARSGS